MFRTRFPSIATSSSPQCVTRTTISLHSICKASISCFMPTTPTITIPGSRACRRLALVEPEPSCASWALIPTLHNAGLRRPEQTLFNPLRIFLTDGATSCSKIPMATCGPLAFRFPEKGGRISSLFGLDNHCTGVHLGWLCPSSHLRPCDGLSTEPQYDQGPPLFSRSLLRWHSIRCIVLSLLPGKV